ncbi:aspartyl-phosphate phosphatase Spo0E family protein [Clostridium sp. C2-6-12]|uniref:aspartyl-phosphate phosphatase Spo0E family protein n=1 Tax=Clostridium sp. C2-6-12 TaxID=2698832 RepID=UPI00136E20FE|nr:aspartyl-phosphate phosphatase Spo0E family protein [Clostridium sp. C2-6-12]
MEVLYDKVKEKLRIKDNMYDFMRVIDPINKKVMNISNQLGLMKDCKCYDFLNRGEVCKNCISLRAEIEKNTFVKLEYISDEVMLIIATPLDIDGEMYIVEAIKNITTKKNNILNHNFKSIIDNVNEKVIEEKQECIVKVNKEEKLSILNYRIQELRNMLNEMNISSKDEDGYKETLRISQDLDDLIVEYMKNAI